MDKNEVETEELERRWKELSNQIANIPSEKAIKTDTMNLMHKYNEVKDATQTVIGALAHIQGVTLKSLHKEFNVPFK